MFERAARYGDGWTMGGGTPDTFREGREKALAAWSAAGRDGNPRTMALFYFALGSDAERVAAENLGDYYAFLGDYAQQVAAGAAKDVDTVKQYISAFRGRRCGRRHLLPRLDRSGRSRAAGSGCALAERRTGPRSRGALEGG